MPTPAVLSLLRKTAASAGAAIKKFGEPLAWLLGLLLLFFMDPSNDGISFCVFRLVGFESCLGCGIGHAIHFALHLKFQQSLSEHIFGIPATIGILYHLFYSFQKLKQNNLKWTNNKCL
jgi:hypothetical protein